MTFEYCNGNSIANYDCVTMEGELAEGDYISYSYRSWQQVGSYQNNFSYNIYDQNGNNVTRY